MAQTYRRAPREYLQPCQVCRTRRSGNGANGPQCGCSNWGAAPSTATKSSKKIQEIKKVFETSKANKKAQQEPESIGTRHRRSSVGRLEDRCTECRMWGLPCDQKHPHCSNCMQNGTICESTKEWFGRVSGKWQSVASRSRSSSTASLSDDGRPETVDIRANDIYSVISHSYEESRRAYAYKGASSLDTTHTSLESLKKNMRGLKAAIDLLGREEEEPEEEEEIQRTDSPSFHIAPDLSSLPAFMDFNSDHSQEESAWATETTQYEMDDMIDPHVLSQASRDDPIPITMERFLDTDYTGVHIEEISSGLPAEPYPSHKNPDKTQAFETVLDGLRRTGRTVRGAARAAHRKLKMISKSRKASRAFRNFVLSLGSLDDILQLGAQTYETLVEGETPRGLKEIYCFLHFAYAMSQADSEKLPESDEREYRNGLLMFRSCLPSTPEYKGTHSQRDIFDEIAHHMAHELECALRWAKKQNLTPTSFQGLSLKDVLRLHSERADSEILARNMRLDLSMRIPTTLAGGNIDRIQDCLQAPASIEVIHVSRVFVGTTNFLKGLSRFGSPFKLFCGDFCRSLAKGTHRNPIRTKENWNRQFDPLETDELLAMLSNKFLNEINGYFLTSRTVSSVLHTALRSFGLGNIMTIGDFVDYIGGLLTMVSLPKVTVNALIDELFRLSSQMMEQVPLYLLDRVQCFNTVSNLDSLDETFLVASDIEPAPLDSQDFDFEAMDLEIDSFIPSAFEYTGCDNSSANSPFTISSTQSPHSLASTPLTDESGSPMSASSKGSYVCHTCGKDFTNKSNLVRHSKTKHDGSIGPKEMIRCHVEGCRTMLGSKRAKENMRTHLRKKHGIHQPYFEPLSIRADILLGM